MQNNFYRFLKRSVYEGFSIKFRMNLNSVPTKREAQHVSNCCAFADEVF